MDIVDVPGLVGTSRNLYKGVIFMWRRILFILVLGLIALMIFNNVSTSLDQQTVATFKNVYKLSPLKNPHTFNDEISAIKIIQHKVLEIAPHKDGIPDYQPREPINLVNARHGFCFDRSRSIDKAVNFIGLPTRHVFLLYRQDRNFFGAIFHYGQRSHAVTEVKTSKGWMLVDSNSEWVALNLLGQPVNADDTWKKANQFNNIPIYLKRPSWAIRGMYSRIGHQYYPYNLFPDVNWLDLFSWVFFG